MQQSNESKQWARFHRRQILLSALALLVMAGGAKSMAESDFRQIPVPMRENGYASFNSQAITTKPEFDKFIKSVEAAQFFNDKEAFLSKLRSSNVEFGKESLILLRHDEGSGSTQIKLNPPQLKDKQLLCKLERKVAQMGTADMAYYCFAFAISKASVKEIVFDNGKRTQTISAISSAK